MKLHAPSSPPIRPHTINRVKQSKKSHDTKIALLNEYILYVDFLFWTFNDATDQKDWKNIKDSFRFSILPLNDKLLRNTKPNKWLFDLSKV